MINDVTYQDAFVQGIRLLQQCTECDLCAEHKHVSAGETAFSKKQLLDKLAEREECCKDICSFCARNIPAVQLGGMTTTRRSSEGCGVWGHKLTAANGEIVSLPCEAQMIRGRAENESKEVVAKFDDGSYGGWPGATLTKLLG